MYVIYTYGICNTLHGIYMTYSMYYCYIYFSYCIFQLLRISYLTQLYYILLHTLFILHIPCCTFRTHFHFVFHIPHLHMDYTYISHQISHTLFISHIHTHFIFHIPYIFHTVFFPFLLSFVFCLSIFILKRRVVPRARTYCSRRHGS